MAYDTDANEQCETDEELEAEIEDLRRRLAESDEALRAIRAGQKQSYDTRARLAAIVESSDDAIIGKTLEGIITSWNRGAKAIYGYSAEEVVGRPISILAPPDRPDEIPMILRTIAIGGKVEHFDTIRVRKDGVRINVSLTVSPIRDSSGEIIGASTIARDITLLKLAEERIYDSERFIRSTIDSLSSSIAILNADGSILYTNQAWKAFAESNSCGIPADMVGVNYLEASSRAESTPDESANAAIEGIRDVIAGRCDEFTLEYPCHSPDEQRWFSMRVTRFAGDGPTRVVVAHDNITEQKQAEEALKASEDKFSKAFSSSPAIATISTLTEGRYIDVNDTFVAAIGYTREETIGHTTYELNLWEDPDEREKVVSAIKGGITVRNREVKLRKRNGDIIYALISADAIELGGQHCLLAVSNDITERKKAEAILQENYERERTIAETLQRSLLPPVSMVTKGFRIVERYQAAFKEAEVGGDFYDVFNLSDGRIALVTGDVSGKGLQAAVHTAMAKYTLRAYAMDGSDPGYVMERLNDAIYEYSPDDMFITVFYGVLDPASCTLTYASSGHEEPLLYSKHDKQITKLPPTGRASGVLPGARYEQSSLHLYPGDVLLVYTDGITDARSKGQVFGLNGIADVLIANASLDEGLIADALFEAATNFAGGSLRDDAAVLVVKSANSNNHIKLS